MKTHDPKNKSKQGSALVITMSIVAVAVLCLASYLIVVQSQIASVSRSQTWNSAISLAEAGMEEGMATINYGQVADTFNPTNTAYLFTNILSSSGWAYTAGATNATKTNYVAASNSGSNYYVVNLTWSGTNTPTVTASGVVTYSTIPWVFSALRQHAFLAQFGSSQSTGGSSGASGGSGSGTSTTTVSMGRRIQVNTVLSPVFAAGIVCKSNFDMSGNNCTVDSFDSSAVALGQYSVAVRQANGNVATDSALINTLNVGNGNIYGYVYTGPGSVQSAVEIGRKGSVGDLGWVSTGTSGIEAGHWAGNYNMNIPDVPAPNTSGWSTSFPPATNGVVMLTNSGKGYYVSALPSSPLVVTAPTAIWVTGSASLGVTISNATWVTTNTGVNVTNTTFGQLILYVGKTSGSGDSLTWSGNNTCNVPGYAANLQIYGLPSLTSVDFHGNSAWIAALYAPEAAFVGGGGGNNTQDTSGAVVCNSVSLNGHWNFHYDQYLAITGPSRGYMASGWREVSYTP